MSHWVGGCDELEHVWVKIFKDTVEKVILKTRNFWKFESATNEQTNERTNKRTNERNLAYEKIQGVLNFHVVKTLYSVC